MSVISTVGRRSWSLRLIVLGLYAVLSAGAVTVVYPFLLMLSTSVTSRVDVDDYRIIPAYLHDGDVLAAKYMEEKYVTLSNIGNAYGLEGPDFRNLPDLVRERRQMSAKLPVRARRTELADWREFGAGLPLGYLNVAFQSPQGMVGRSENGFRACAEMKYRGDLARCRTEYREELTRFSAIALPFERLIDRDYLPERSIKFDDFLAFKRGLDRDDLCVVGLDAAWAGFLRSRYQGSLADLNREFVSSFTDFHEVHISERVPQRPGRERELWGQFVRGRLPFSFVAVRDGARRFADFLAAQGEAFSDRAYLQKAVAEDFDRPELLAIADVSSRFHDFLQVQKLEDLAVLSAENLYRRFLAQRYGTVERLNAAHGSSYGDWLQVSTSMLAADLEVVERGTGGLRWRYFTRNYREVIGFLLLHGSAIWNTIVLVVLSLMTQLIVNPLAAYALSRFQLPYTNKILIFCLATMAFPPEVAMIPNFLLLRSFPLAQLLVGVVTFALIFALYAVIARKRAPMWIGLVAALILAAAATQAIPGGKISLLNSYWALILPGVANGFSIFLLKGFFDTLPKEIFEAATMEGAGEMRMFWQISLPMCAPVLAVIALGTFTATYGSFMWAFLVCQKEEMWTLMVWLYEMQQWAPKYLMTAALTVAAIPTLVIFLLCQRFILRGIVLPTLH